MKNKFNYLFVALIIMLFFSFAFSVKKSISKYAYVDFNSLTEGYNKATYENKEFIEKTKILQANADRLIKNWKHKKKNLLENQHNMSKKDLAYQSKLLTLEQERVFNYQETIEIHIQNEKQKLRQTIINEVLDYLKEYGKVHGYSFIIESDRNENNDYAHKYNDLTTEVLYALNSELNTE